MGNKIIITGGFRFNRNEAAEARVLNNAKIFRDLGYNVEFICWGGEYIPEEKKGDKYFKQGFEYSISNDLSDNYANLFIRLKNFVIRGKKSVSFIKKTNPDIVIGYNPSAYFTLKMLSLSKKRGFRFISDITEWYDSSEFIGGKWLPFSWINSLNMKFVQKKVKDKIVISNYLNNYYQKSNNIVIPPMIDPADQKWKPQDSIREEVNGITLIFAGNAGIKDRLGNIIRGVCEAHLKGTEVRLLILGSDIKQTEAISEKGITEKYPGVILPLGKIPQDVVPEYYSKSDFSMVIREPSRKNMAGFPTKFAESMAAGCPVIANSTSDLSEYLIDGYNGYLIEDWSSENIMELLVKIKDKNILQMKDMRNNALACASKYFSFKEYIEPVSHFLQN